MSAIEQLQDANQAVATAAALIGAERDTINRFLKEARDIESFGHVIAPTLFRNEERRVVSAALTPIYEAAQAFLVAYETHTKRLKEAAAKVGVGDAR